MSSVSASKVWWPNTELLVWSRFGSWIVRFWLLAFLGGSKPTISQSSRMYYTEKRSKVYWMKEENFLRCQMLKNQRQKHQFSNDDDVDSIQQPEPDTKHKNSTTNHTFCKRLDILSIFLIHTFHFPHPFISSSRIANNNERLLCRNNAATPADSKYCFNVQLSYNGC